MVMAKLFYLAVCVFLLAGDVSADEDADVFVENNSPIIGVLAQEIAYSLEKIYPGEYHSFIAASYVKFIEGGGGRVVPVW